MIDYPALAGYAERYAAMATEPLRISLVLRRGSRLAGYDPMNLDNLLASCVVNEATGWRGLPNSEEPYILPIPVKRLWEAPNGCPLWATTVFRPLGQAVGDVAYWHKRHGEMGHFTGTKRGTFAIRSTSGRWMDRRVPLPTQIADCWVAECEGNALEIGRLLEPVVHVGKRRSIGFGEVDYWLIEPIERFDLMADGKLTRPLPGLAVHLLDGMMPEGAPSPVGWTPPEWKPSLFAPGWWSGTPITRDWYASA